MVANPGVGVREEPPPCGSVDYSAAVQELRDGLLGIEAAVSDFEVEKLVKQAVISVVYRAQPDTVEQQQGWVPPQVVPERELAALQVAPIRGPLEAPYPV